MIEIDSFTGLEQERMAGDIVRLVRGDKEWLKLVRPDVWKKHKKIERSIQTLVRAVVDNEISIHIPRRDGEAIALARDIKILTVRHPLEAVALTGRWIDYWARADVTPDEHEELVHELMTLHGYEGTVLATLRSAETERALGIPAMMQAVGVRSWLEVPQSQDRLGLSLFPDLQLYSYEV
jgi:hypothetical protein